MREQGARCWRPPAVPVGATVPARLRPWLNEPGSLTRRLRYMAGGAFTVRVCTERWGRPWLDERRRLGLTPRRRAWLREVVLGCGEQPWIVARSVMPEPTLGGPLRRLRGLGARPLGSVLFGHYAVVRGPIEVARLDDGDALAVRAAGLGGQPGEWARRSVFRIGGRPLLVTEVFLPPLLEACRRWP